MQVEYSEARRNGISWTLASATPNTPIKGVEVPSSANNNVGRQIWMFEEKSVCQERGAVGKRIPEARAAYQKSSETIRHSADEVYRSLCADKRKDSFETLQNTFALFKNRMDIGLGTTVVLCFSYQVVCFTVDSIIFVI